MKNENETMKKGLRKDGLRTLIGGVGAGDAHLHWDGVFVCERVRRHRRRGRVHQHVIEHPKHSLLDFAMDVDLRRGRTEKKLRVNY